MINITKFFNLAIVIPLSLCLAGCSDRWPTNDELAETITQLIEEKTISETQARTAYPVTYAKAKAFFENCDRKWKEKNKITGDMEFNYQSGEEVVTYYWADYGKDFGGKRIIPKMKNRYMQ